MGCVKLQSLDPESTVFTPLGRGVCYFVTALKDGLTVLDLSSL